MILLASLLLVRKNNATILRWVYTLPWKLVLMCVVVKSVFWWRKLELKEARLLFLRYPAGIACAHYISHTFG